MIDLRANPFYLKEEQIAWVNQTLASLTLEEKVGQLFCPIGMSTDEGALHDLAVDKKIGGLLFRPGKGEEVQEAHRYLQQQAKVPLLIAANLEAGGTGIAVDGTRIGNPMLLAATGDADYGHHLGEVCAKEGTAVGVNWAFAPVVDIDYNFHNPITNVRTYGSDPETVLNYAQGFVEGVQQNGVAASIKHFPGDGIDFRDQHLVTSVNTLPIAEWRSTYGKVYSGLIEAGALSVMIGHIALPAVQKAEEDAFLPATLSPVIMQELLRKELGFNGLITTDATPMVGFCAAMERRLAVPTAIAAGCDIFLFNKDLEEDIRFMQEGIETGILTLDRLDEAVTRILAMKAALQLPEKQAESLLVPAKEELAVLRKVQHVEWAKQAADNGITLVKDTAGNLPLRPEATPRLLLQLIGPYEEANTQIASTVIPLLEKAGFQVTLYQPEDFTTGFDSVSQFHAKYDAVLYLANVENRSNATTTRINWYTFFGQGNNIPWFVDEVPTVFASLGNPYHLMDVPMVKTYINAYDNHQAVIEALVAKLLGKSDFKGVSPIDPYCGLMDARR
ncbi:beta-N-acetylhexosaminidase [Trichococcus patagoniensis]|uniref:beta-N-acetylhexosaminidase n=1 Tax=Trichococcus patagoniensis TaxID=382641 RepID=A0A2T5IGJ9_9LACT|nr:glycoside hydrolase family 3 N-terminal domain-containing protein [Trichococcus patagoniensis]PTQ82957.1 beta-N-acetylhexosaminidase [Trichococcus patagoniensis]